MISAKHRSEIPLGEEEEVEGNIITYLECEVYIRQEKQYLCYIWGKDKAI